MRAVLAVVIACMLWPALASAHGVKLFAERDGERVVGYGFFVGGGRAAGAAIHVETNDGEVVFDGTTDEQGGFAFYAPSRAGLRLTLDLGDGHRAAAEIAARSGDAPTGSNVAKDLEARAEDATHIHLSDVLGGLGVLFGLTMTGLWWAERRKRLAAEATG